MKELTFTAEISGVPPEVSSSESLICFVAFAYAKQVIQKGTMLNHVES